MECGSGTAGYDLTEGNKQRKTEARMNIVFGKYLVFLGMGVLLAGGCEKERMSETDHLPVEQLIVLSIEGYDQVDSAQVLFFRELSGRDSLFEQKTVYQISKKPQSFDFRLPPGYYLMKVAGNVPAERIVARPPFSSDSVLIDYQGINDIPAVYYGSRRFNVGVDQGGLSGLVLFTCGVELTLRGVPAGVERIKIELLHTASGVTLNGGILPEMFPPLSAVIDDVTADSTYVVELSGFPNPQGVKGSVVQVKCYDSEEREVYSGKSVSFPSQPGRRRVVACSFTARSAAPAVKGLENQIYWEYDEENF